MSPTTLLTIVLSFYSFYSTNSEGVFCTGDCSCDAIASQPDELCTLNCLLADSCKSHSLTCPTGRPCTVLCDGISACADATFIYARESTDVHVICNTVDSCKAGLRILCGTGDCRLTCSIDHPTACEDLGIVHTAGANAFICDGNCPPDTASLQFSANPTPNPTDPPTFPTANPTLKPTINPTKSPTRNPTIDPTKTPSNNPSVTPTKYPTNQPSISPSNFPSIPPTKNPSFNPSFEPTYFPSQIPSQSPTFEPTVEPSENPSFSPSTDPTVKPSMNPTTAMPTGQPSHNPTQKPSHNPTQNPSVDPTVIPTVPPTQTPTNGPTSEPSTQPTHNPTAEPSANPSFAPTNEPTLVPTNTPTSEPTKEGIILNTNVDNNVLFVENNNDVLVPVLWGMVTSVCLVISVTVIICVVCWRRKRQLRDSFGTTVDSEEMHQKDGLIEMTEVCESSDYWLKIYFNGRSFDFILDGSGLGQTMGAGMCGWNEDTFEDIMTAIKNNFGIKHDNIGLHQIVSEECTVDIDDIDDIAAAFHGCDQRKVDIYVKIGNGVSVTVGGKNGQKLESSDSDTSATNEDF